MYETQSYEVLLKRMLAQVPYNLDKREGSLIYDALAPAAAELAQMYAELDINNNLSYADTATEEYLERRTAEFGVTRQPATKARRKGLFFDGQGNALDISIGSRFSLEGINYVALNRLDLGQYVMECEWEGSLGNQRFGEMIPIDYIPGLARGELSDVLVPGEDVEPDEALRKRYFERQEKTAFGGNITDYKEKVSTIPGVGGTKIFPVWAGGGTVKCIIIASDFGQPSSELIDEVQTIIDPEKNQGQGIGLAPIGHTVTIAGVSCVSIDFETTVLLDAGITPNMVQEPIETALNDYLIELRKGWKDQERLIVRISQIEARLLTVSGIIDISESRLSGSGSNIELSQEEIPILGTVTVHGG